VIGVADDLDRSATDDSDAQRTRVGTIVGTNRAGEVERRIHGCVPVEAVTLGQANNSITFALVRRTKLACAGSA